MSSKLLPTSVYTRPSRRSRQICLLCQHNQTIKRSFSRTSHRSAEPFQDHYATLSLTPSATPADIKKQFYTLSKKYHPDLHPNDPDASKKFVKVSEAYHTLGSQTARQQYDQIYFAEKGGGSRRARSGSYSSASEGGPAGARPASGLSRRRTQFRGPPPSFYRNGAWGVHGAKRSAAQGESHTGEQSQAPPSGAAYTSTGGPSGSNNSPSFGSGGFSPGQEAEWDYDPSIPHWDRAGHFRTHEGIRKRSSGRSGVQNERNAYDEVTSGGSLLFNFVAVSGVLGLVVSVPAFFMAK